MISRAMKVSKILESYPDTLEVFIKVSPHFQKLKNKLLRKALAGRVTVEQASSIAGVDADYLLSELNKAIGVTDYKNTPENKKDQNEETNSSSGSIPGFLISLPDENITTLDVRPILNSGKDPLKDILSAARELEKEKVLLIINSFEPIPLYSVLKEKGFSHWTEKESGIWKIYFFKEENKIAQDAKEIKSSSIINISDYQNVVEVDVHDLPAPEPMIKILETLSQIDDKSVMVVYHHREPNLLYPRLEERGYAAACTRLDENKYQILIAKRRNI